VGYVLGFWNKILKIGHGLDDNRTPISTKGFMDIVWYILKVFLSFICKSLTSLFKFV